MITTIITTYHRPKLLKRAVESVLSQTYPNFKVCVYDNGSDEETSNIMREFLEKDSRVFYHRHPENIGMMGNYKYAYERVDTKYFSFLSDDDYLLPHFYETALRDYEIYPDAGFVACRVTAYDENQQLVGDVLSRWERQGYYKAPMGMVEMLKSNGRFPVPTGVLFQTEIVKDISPDWRKEVQLLWDPDYLLQISAKYPFVINKEICAIYCAHADAFSTEYYMDVFESTKNLHVYVTATSAIQQKILASGLLRKDIKRLANLAFLNMVADVFNIYLWNYGKRKKYKEALHALRVYKDTYGYNKQIVTILFVRTVQHLINFLPSRHTVFHALKMPLRMAKRSFKKLISGKS